MCRAYIVCKRLTYIEVIQCFKKRQLKMALDCQRGPMYSFVCRIKIFDGNWFMQEAESIRRRQSALKDALDGRSFQQLNRSDKRHSSCLLPMIYFCVFFKSIKMRHFIAISVRLYPSKFNRFVSMLHIAVFFCCPKIFTRIYSDVISVIISCCTRYYNQHFDN